MRKGIGSLPESAEAPYLCRTVFSPIYLYAFMPLPVLRPRGEFLGVLFKLDLSAQDRGRGSCRDGNLINYQVSEQKYRTVQ